MVDFHIHVLPGVDHGSSHLAETIEMLRGSAKAGVSTFIAAHHFYPSSTTVDRFLAKREHAYHETVNALPEDLKHINIIKGAEVMICPGIENMKNLEKLCIGDTLFILLELPYVFWTDWVFNTIYEIISKRSLIPIIAHVERYVAYNNFDNIKTLLQMDVVAQMNAYSICKIMTRQNALMMVREGMIHVLGSDRHSQSTGAKDMQKAYKILKRRFGQKKIDFFIGNAEEVLNNRLPQIDKPII